MSRHDSRFWLRAILVVVLAAIAEAGLATTSFTKFARLAEIPLSNALLIPGIMLIGFLLAVAIDDIAVATVGVCVAAGLAACLYGLAVALPGFRIAALQVRMINDGTVDGLLVLLLAAPFGLAGTAIAWVVESFRPPGQS